MFQVIVFPIYNKQFTILILLLYLLFNLVKNKAIPKRTSSIKMLNSFSFATIKVFKPYSSSCWSDELWKYLENVKIITECFQKFISIFALKILWKWNLMIVIICWKLSSTVYHIIILTLIYNMKYFLDIYETLLRFIHINCFWNTIFISILGAKLEAVAIIASPNKDFSH